MKSLLLEPKSLSNQRIWRVNECELEGCLIENSSDFYLAVEPDQHDSFFSLRLILSQLRDLLPSNQCEMIINIENYINEVIPLNHNFGSNTYGSLLTDSVAFAIMRRISRESVYTARIIDLSARMLNSVFSQLDYVRVHVKYVDRLDRLTIKVLTRAMLLLKVNNHFSWVWHSSSDPANLKSNQEDDFYLASRSALLYQVFRIIRPTFYSDSCPKQLSRPDESKLGEVSIYSISADLVLQNYDSVFLKCDFLEKKEDIIVAEVLRLRALASLNIGKTEDCLADLQLAEETSNSVAYRAHLAYLQGLVEAKRKYNLIASNSHYERGINLINTSNAIRGDISLEKAWLLNGLALNEVVIWQRKSSGSSQPDKAFKLIHQAFALVCDGNDPARTYLRFNLLANSAFLMEMQGHYNLAIDIFHKVFESSPGESEAEQIRRISTINYRIGVLHYRAGHLDKAYQLLEIAADQDKITENRSTQERILRALGVVAIESGRFAEASCIFTKGLEICLDARSAEGAFEHGRGLIVSLLLNGKKDRADELCKLLSTDENLSLVPVEKLSMNFIDEISPRSPSPKLPAYIPEIDLESVPEIDLNRFLSNVSSSNMSNLSVWRS